jgi:hypothetical protein
VLQHRIGGFNEAGIGADRNHLPGHDLARTH